MLVQDFLIGTSVVCMLYVKMARVQSTDNIHHLKLSMADAGRYKELRGKGNLKERETIVYIYP